MRKDERPTEGGLQSRVDIALSKVYRQDKKVTPETEEKQTSKV